MPVNTPHPDYSSALIDWQICRAVTGSSRELKRSPAIRSILPPLAGHRLNPDDYTRYLERAYFFPACGRYIDGLIGMLCQSSPSITAAGGDESVVLKQINEWAVDVTGAKCSLVALRRYITDEIARVGRVAIVVDFPPVEQPISVREADQYRLVPTVALYKAESLINWDSKTSGGRELLSLAVFEEEFAGRSKDDEFVIEKKKRWREWSLAENPKNGATENARVRIWVEPEKGKSADGKPVLSQEYWPKLPGGAYLDALPVYIGGVNGVSVAITPAAVDDLVDINAAHFRNSADLEHSLVLAGHPLRYITGYDFDNENGLNPLGITQDNESVDGDFRVDIDGRASSRMGLRQNHGWEVGSDRIWMIKAPDAKVGVISASESQNGALVSGMKNKEDHLIAVGGRILAIDKAGAEAARTEELRRSGERSVAQMVCDAVAEILTEVVRMAALWMGIAPEQAQGLMVSGRVDVLQSMTPDEANAWASLWQGRIIARTDLLLILKRGGAIGQERTGKSIDEENEIDPPEMGGTDLLNDVEDEPDPSKKPGEKK